MTVNDITSVVHIKAKEHVAVSCAQNFENCAGMP